MTAPSKAQGASGFLAVLRLEDRILEIEGPLVVQVDLEESQLQSWRAVTRPSTVTDTHTEHQQKSSVCSYTRLEMAFGA